MLHHFRLFSQKHFGCFSHERRKKGEKETRRKRDREPLEHWRFWFSIVGACWVLQSPVSSTVQPYGSGFLLSSLPWQSSLLVFPLGDASAPFSLSGLPPPPPSFFSLPPSLSLFLFFSLFCVLKYYGTPRRATPSLSIFPSSRSLALPRVYRVLYTRKAESCSTFWEFESSRYKAPQALASFRFRITRFSFTCGKL